MLEKFYEHKQSEEKISTLWEKEEYFTHKNNSGRKVFSLFLTPPNASGEIHIGNAFDIAIQDILARHSRAKGIATVWIPGTDHGGFETQVTFEKKTEKEGKNKFDYNNKELFKEIKKFVNGNNTAIKKQIKSLGASVDWSRFRFTMDKESILYVYDTFKKMVSNGLIYRNPYMVNYCPICKTVLSDIELKQNEKEQPLYIIKFPFIDSTEHLLLSTARPEFIFASTHILIQKEDQSLATLIGRKLINPITDEVMELVESKRKFNPENSNQSLSIFSPSYKKYDYEYALRHNIPSKNLLDWNGKMIERYPGISPFEAREKEIEYLKNNNSIQTIDSSHVETTFFCKKGHEVESVIMFTWFLKIDDKKTSLRKNALEGIKKENLVVLPQWRKKGLVEWLEKMTDWPIARQNVWGIKIPIWYDISDPSKFLIWFIDNEGKKQHGNLKFFLDSGISPEEISQNLERIYTPEINSWTMQKEVGKLYLPETDTFDTWFSSNQWPVLIHKNNKSKDFDLFYPNQSVVTGHDLLRLAISREILLSQYLTNKLPFKVAYFHPLIKGNDGQKMSKSLGNSISLSFYLENYGADVTRMTLISYTSDTQDFIFEESRLIFFRKFSERLWKMGRICEIANQHTAKNPAPAEFLVDDNNMLMAMERLSRSTSISIEKYYFSSAQKGVIDFLSDLENYASKIKKRGDYELSFYVFQEAFKKYVSVLHPFMPFLTEELNLSLFNFSLAKGKII